MTRALVNADQRINLMTVTQKTSLLVQNCFIIHENIQKRSNGSWLESFLTQRHTTIQCRRKLVNVVKCTKIRQAISAGREKGEEYFSTDIAKP